MTEKKTKKNGAPAGPKKTKRQLRVKLTEEEAREKAATWARLYDERRRLEAEKKEKAAMYTKILKEKSARIDELAEDVRLGSELRDVDCEERMDFTRNQVDTHRLDTGERIDHRAMTAKERQLEIGA